MNLYRYATVSLVFCLFTVGSFPAVGEAFPGLMHWLVHFMTYALIAFLFGLGWRSMGAIYIAVIVAATGTLHEVSEIVTHSHAFEFRDAIVNALGALMGIVILYVFRKFWQKSASQVIG
jgi:VanZ family protein